MYVCMYVCVYIYIYICIYTDIHKHGMYLLVTERIQTGWGESVSDTHDEVGGDDDDNDDADPAVQELQRRMMTLKYVFVRMYACMRVCMHVCMSVRMKT